MGIKGAVVGGHNSHPITFNSSVKFRVRDWEEAICFIVDPLSIRLAEAKCMRDKLCLFIEL